LQETIYPQGQQALRKVRGADIVWLQQHRRWGCRSSVCEVHRYVSVFVSSCDPETVGTIAPISSIVTTKKGVSHIDNECHPSFDIVLCRTRSGCVVDLSPQIWCIICQTNIRRIVCRPYTHSIIVVYQPNKQHNMFMRANRVCSVYIICDFHCHLAQCRRNPIHFS
jgi:hypothetical protein